MMSLHSSMHSSQMNTDGPAMSFFTSCWLLPQKEQYRTFSLEEPFLSAMDGCAGRGGAESNDSGKADRRLPRGKGPETALFRALRRPARDQGALVEHLVDQAVVLGLVGAT